MGIYNPAASLFEGIERIELLDKLGDPLRTMNEQIDWSIFESTLLKYFPIHSKPQGGRPRMHPLKMFKIVLLQKMYDLSDKAAEFQLADRLSFQRFVGISSTKSIPDEKTIWLFKEELSRKDLVSQLFDLFKTSLIESGLILRDGKIVDASIVKAPRQRNTREENELIKEGKCPKDWQEKPNKKRQKDLDASWTKKHKKTYYGYKDHIKIGAKSKLIEEYQVGSCNEHDSEVLFDLLETTDQGKTIHADSAYRSQEIEEELAVRNLKSRIHEKGYRNKPLTKMQKKSNRKKSKIRARVEHVFGHIKMKMGGLKVRGIGIKRATRDVGLFNLLYNMQRSIYLKA